MHSGSRDQAAPSRRLDGRERRLVAGAALAPVVLAILVLAPVAMTGPSGPVDVVIASVVYGGLLGLAAAFVTVDRLHARRCPRCGERNLPRAPACEDCGYDIVQRPRYACAERHEVRYEPGLCDCGRRLQQLETARGIGREIRFILRIGLWVFVFLMLLGVALRLLS